MKASFDIHYFPFYISRWRDSESRIGLNLEQRMLYWELIFFCYRTGSLPKDRQSLVKIAACSEKEFDRSWTKVRLMFTDDGERLHHPVVDEILPDLQDKHERRKKAGSLGGVAKASNATAMLKPENSIALASEQNRTEQNKEEKKNSPTPHIPASATRRGRELLFEQFWSVVWQKIGKGAAVKVWNKKATDRETALRIIEAAKEQTPAILAAASKRDGSVLHPATWLNAERYDDEIVTPKTITQRWDAAAAQRQAEDDAVWEEIQRGEVAI